MKPNLNQDWKNTFYSNCHDKFQQISNLIAKSSKIIILGHIRPDGDCIGAQLAFLQSLQKKYSNKQIKAPFAANNNLDFLLPKNYQNEITEKELKDALIIIVDVAVLTRLPIKINKKQPIIKIDHHPQQEEFGTMSWIDENSISTCEMVYFLLNFLKLPIGSKVATALLTGIITDSGHFKYQNTKQQTFWAAYQLMKKGAKLQEINQKVYQKKEQDLKTMQWILQNYVKKKNLIYLNFLPKDKKALPFIKGKSDIKKFINLFQNIESIKIWVMFLQMDSNKPIFVSIRSQNVAINQIAEKYQGGGHQNAAAIELTEWNSIKKIIKELEEIASND